MAGRPIVENVDVNVTATDKASKTIGKVADAVDELPADVAVEVTADDQASDDLQRVERRIAELQAENPMIDVEASGIAKVLRDLDEVRRAAGKVDDESPVIDVKVDQAAKKRAVDDLDDVTRKGAGLTGGAVNSLSDLSGPLGDVSGQVSEFGQAFVGAAELAGPALANVGVDVEKFAGMLGVGGVALGAIIYFWQTFVGGADRAKDKLKDVQEQMAAGDFVAAAKGITDALQPWRSIMDDVGVSVNAATKFVTGQTDVLPLNAAAVADATSKQHFLAAELQRQRQYWIDNHGDLKQHQEDQFQATRAIGGTTEALLTQARVALPEVQKEILAYVAQVNGIPPSRFTEITTDANPDDVQQVEDEINNVARDRASTVNVDADTTDAERAINGLANIIRNAVIPVGVKVGTTAAGGASSAAASTTPAALGATTNAVAKTAPPTAGGAAVAGTVLYATYHVNVYPPVGTPTAEVGRYVADALDAHERRTGSRRRVA